jgi:hypothetical protein
VAESAQQVLLPGVAAVEGADAETRTLRDGGDRRFRIVEEHRAGGVEDRHVVLGGLAAATGETGGRSTPG